MPYMFWSDLMSPNKSIASWRILFWVVWHQTSVLMVAPRINREAFGLISEEAYKRPICHFLVSDIVQWIDGGISFLGGGNQSPCTIKVSNLLPGCCTTSQLTFFVLTVLFVVYTFDCYCFRFRFRFGWVFVFRKSNFKWSTIFVDWIFVPTWHTTVSYKSCLA